MNTYIHQMFNEIKGLSDQMSRFENRMSVDQSDILRELTRLNKRIDSANIRMNNIDVRINQVDTRLNNGDLRRTSVNPVASEWT